MRNATIDYYGLYTWDSSLFDNLVIPTEVDRQTLIDKILYQTLELEVLYNDPNYAKYRIGVWSKSRIGVWNELVKTMGYDYDPISNYDRKEQWSDRETRDLKNTVGRKQEDSTENTSTQSEDSTSTDRVSAFNDSGFVDKQQNEYEGNATATSRGKINSNMDEAGTDTGTIVHDHDLRAYGNIGVTTTQQMIQEQRDIVMFNMYDVIVNEFINEFCIRVY